MPRAVPVSESFVSIQGEGLLTGVPSAFIRLSGCNLRCAWCDTPYASWQPDGSPRSIDDLAAWARSTGVRHAVITGGEPMLFPQLCELSARLAEPVPPRIGSAILGAGGRGHGMTGTEAGEDTALGGTGGGMHVTIETAGTVIPHDPHRPLTCDLMSISPKLSNSTPTNDPRDPSGAWAARHEERRLNIPILQRLLDQFPAPRRQIKFVVCSAPDLAEIDSLLSRLRGWTPDDVLLMPEGVTPPTPERRRLLLDAGRSRGFRYCHRLHLELFGNTRGT